MFQRSWHCSGGAHPTGGTHCHSDCYHRGILLVEVYIECRNLINILHSTPDRRKKTNKSDFAVSANIAYGQVNLEAERAGGASEEYEDLISWQDLVIVDGTMNQLNIQLLMNSLLANRRHQRMLQHKSTDGRTLNIVCIVNITILAQEIDD